ncbi:Uncharacterized protein dnm_053020 [Desulfonema magnum]|uniref:Uncharacterized protein n=1 Tax=Desulfonema magnum TaxID=45655 RepID=A0A975BPV7_9BACT|nr:Uncharacterized protein dnm_053020 [Desulfonema magnum]
MGKYDFSASKIWFQSPPFPGLWSTAGKDFQVIILVSIPSISGSLVNK